jgi:hypothetical protein
MFQFAQRFRERPAMNLRDAHHCDKFLLWIDAVGGFWVCLADEVVLGRPEQPRGGPDVPILADLSARHARIRRDHEGYVIEALREVRLDGRPVRPATWLADGNRIELGEGVRLLFRRPHPLSATARLDFLSRHRTQPSTDGVLLMADSCVLGPNLPSHVLCRDWPQEIIIFRSGEHGDELFCRSSRPFEIDGLPHKDRGRLGWNSRVTGEGFSFNLEVIE